MSPSAPDRLRSGGDHDFALVYAGPLREYRFIRPQVEAAPDEPGARGLLLSSAQVAPGPAEAYQQTVETDSTIFKPLQWLPDSRDTNLQPLPF